MYFDSFYTALFPPLPSLVKMHDLNNILTHALEVID